MINLDVILLRQVALEHCVLMGHQGDLSEKPCPECHRAEQRVRDEITRDHERQE